MTTKRKPTSKPSKAAEPAAQPNTAPKNGRVLAGLREALDKKLGKGSARLLDSKLAAAQVTEVLSTGLDVLDHYLLGRGGLPVGRIVEIFGEEACLAGDTFINFQVRRPDGTLANSKGGTIEHLYRRFHGQHAHHLALEHAEFWAPSVNEEDCIVQNKIVDVVDSGERECFELLTSSGERVVATADHEFYVGRGEYRQLSDLRPGDVVFVHNNTRNEKADKAKPGPRSYLHVRHHPIAGEKRVGARYVYKKLARARAVMEAALNGLSLPDYLSRLNSGSLAGLQFLPRTEHVHHIDGNERNDALENLRVVSGGQHNREHALEEHNNLRFIACATTVEAVIEVGPRRTYDVKMADPYRNVVADKVVVHNCGKSALLYHLFGVAQRAGCTTVLLDPEFAFDDQRAGELGCDADNLLIVDKRALEDVIVALHAVLDAHNSKNGILLIGWDSIAATKTRAGISADAGDKTPAEVARIFSDELPKLLPKLHEKRALLVALNQTRTKFGVMFGDPTTTPGGKAVKFYCSTRLQFFGGKAVKDAAGRHVAKVVTLMTVKSRMAPPFRKVRLRFNYATGYDNAWSTVEHAKTEKVLAPRKAATPKQLKEAYDASIRALGWAGAGPGTRDGVRVVAPGDGPGALGTVATTDAPGPDGAPGSEDESE